MPTAAVLAAVEAAPVAVLLSASLAVIPAAWVMGKATEELAAQAGPGIGGLLNVTFGNAPELIIAVVALSRGLTEVVKASIAGSVISNVLLVLGAAMVVGGKGRNKQVFSLTAIQAQLSMMLLGLVALVMPALVEVLRGNALPGVGAVSSGFGSTANQLSVAIALVLIASYALGLLFSLRTHRQLFNPYSGQQQPQWSARGALAALCAGGVLVGIFSEILVGSIDHAASEARISQFFIGVVLVAVVGNAAEHAVAVVAAAKDKMDLAVNIAVGSAAQIALFVTPVLVLLSLVVGPHPLALVFNGYEIAGLVAAVVLAGFVTQEGESNWFEGVQLLSVYAVLVLVFWFA